MSSVTSRKLLQKRDFFEGSTTSMADSVDENLPCGQSNKSLLGLVRDTDGLKFRFPSRSQSCGEVYNSGTVGGWPGGVGVSMAETLVFPTLSSANREPTYCLFGTAWYACICQSILPYMRGRSRFPPDLGHCW